MELLEHCGSWTIGVVGTIRRLGLVDYWGYPIIVATIKFENDVTALIVWETNYCNRLQLLLNIYCLPLTTLLPTTYDSLPNIHFSANSLHYSVN